MSLQVWLPLNGNLENKGLKDVKITNSGTTTNASGKIGSCYSFDGSSSYLKCEPAIFNNSTKEWSYSCWFKPNTVHAGCLFSNRTAADTTGITIFYYTSNQILFDDGVRWQFTPSPVITVGSWNHLAFTRSSTGKKFYLNGILVSSTSTVGTLSKANASFSSIGCSQNTTTTATINPLNGYLNDVRIYDHCLSAKEVKELSKGLVLHYKLDEPNVNLLRGIPKLTATNSYNAYQLQMTENLVAGQTYTLQLWDVDVSHSEKTVAQTGVWVYWGGGSVHLFNWAGSTYFTNGHADHLSYTFTVTSANASGSGATNSWFNIYNSVGYIAGTMSLTIGAWKLEKGSNATAATLTANEINANSVYDSSGYGNEGSVVGTSSKNPDTPKYRSSIYMSNSGTTNHIEVNNALAFDNSQITVSFWTNASLNRSQVIFADNNLSIEFGILGGVAYLYPPSSKTGFTTSHYVDGQWNHIVTIKNGTSYYLYINGQQESAASSSNYYIHNTKLWLLNRSYNTTYAAIGGVSDFRIYSTVLSEADILELYHTSASVDDNGNVYAREVEEK